VPTRDGEALQGITRRDFLGALATSAALIGAPDSRAEPQSEPPAPTGPPPTEPARSSEPVGTAAPAAAAGERTPSADTYPPLRTGLRGQYPGSFEIAHAVRDGQYAAGLDAIDTAEHYDLAIVGAGISGLSAAYLYRKALGPEVRVLILDNHDDFGGHAKRNEFHYGGRTYLSFGGTMSVLTPFPYSHAAKALSEELGIELESFPRYYRPERFKGLSTGVFFDREHFAGERVVAGFGERPWREFFAAAPLSAAVRADLIRIHESTIDYLPHLDPEQKAQALKRMSYRSFLADEAHLAEASLAFFNGMGWSFRNNMQSDTCPAFKAWRGGAAGFAGMKIRAEPEFETPLFHFPDGNASFARLLVSRLVPAVFSGPLNQESVVLARADYSRLDSDDSRTRIRLQSTAVRVEHLREPDRATERAVRVVCSRGGRLEQMTAANVILACFNNIIPYIVPSLPESQKQALHYASKVPMQITNVLLRTWEPWERLRVHSIHAPNGYHQEAMLDLPTVIGGYESVHEPDQPIVVQMVRNPHRPGVARREQHRLGRADMLATPFEATEREVRQQLQRMLGPAGFDAQRDILALTVNRWPHGYAYTYDTLGDPDMPDSDRPHVLGRRPFGRIAIANADSGAAAFTNVAMDQAERAVSECLASRGLI